MTEHRIRYVGAAASALTVATVVADADGVDLTSSEPPFALADGNVRLDLTVRGPTSSIADAVDGIRAVLPAGSSLELDPS